MNPSKNNNFHWPAVRVPQNLVNDCNFADSTPLRLGYVLKLTDISQIPISRLGKLRYTLQGGCLSLIISAKPISREELLSFLKLEGEMICAARVNVKYLAEKERSSSLEIARAFSPLFALLFIQRAKLRIAKNQSLLKFHQKTCY